LRQPLEDGKITILRAKQKFTLPAEFLLIAACNPCPCGYKDDPENECSCSTGSILQYKRKISGPILDRFDLKVNVPKIKYEELEIYDPKEIENENKIREKIKLARKIQYQRFRENRTNSQMTNNEIQKYCELEDSSKSLLKSALNSGKLSPRGYFKTLKVARTIADLEGNEKILHENLSEALSFRIRIDI
jgi:magnesium chelatase family protein